jgi:hypothetical protein
LVKIISDEDKHKTGRQSSTSDFVKHACAAVKNTVWENGKQVEKSIVQKKEFNSIEGNEGMIAVNARAADKCSYCGLSIESEEMLPCTDRDVEALSK